MGVFIGCLWTIESSQTKVVGIMAGIIWAGCVMYLRKYLSQHLQNMYSHLGTPIPVLVLYTVLVLSHRPVSHAFISLFLYTLRVIVCSVAC